MFPELESERLFLRQIKSTDKSKIFEGLSDPLVIKYYGISYSSYEAVEEQMIWYKDLWEKKTGIWWAVCNKNNNEFCGACGFNNLQLIHQKAEIGFWLLPSFWGKGIIPEAVQILVDYAFQNLTLHRIEAFVEVGNINSKNVVEKMEFKHEGTMVDAEIKNENYISLDIFAKVNSI